MSRESGHSKGFVFVEISNDAQAQKATNELNQAEYYGKVINVSVAKPSTERDNGGNFSRRGYNPHRRY